MTLPSTWKDAAFWGSTLAAGLAAVLLQPDPSPLWKYIVAFLVPVLPLVFAGVRHKDNAKAIEAHETDIQQIKAEP